MIEVEAVAVVLKKELGNRQVQAVTDLQRSGIFDVKYSPRI